MKHSACAPFSCRFVRAVIALSAMVVLPVAWAAELTLTWSDNSDNETGFKIERSTDGSSYAEITTVEANTETYPDIELLADTTYWYRVRATNSAGNSERTCSTGSKRMPQIRTGLKTR